MENILICIFKTSMQHCVPTCRFHSCISVLLLSFGSSCHSVKKGLLERRKVESIEYMYAMERRRWVVRGRLTEFQIAKNNYFSR